MRTQRFPDGQQEVVAFSVAVQRRFQELRLRPRSMRGKREQRENETDDDLSGRVSKSQQTSIERSRRNVRKRVKAIMADRMLTLSMRDSEVSIELWARAWDGFRRRLNRLHNFHYVAVLEPNQRGGWHMHVAVSGRQNWNLLRSIWLSVISKLGTDGAVNDSSGDRKFQALAKKMGGKGRAMRHMIAGYISKYIGKDVDETSFNKKRYWTSKGIPVPEVEPYAHLGRECDAVDAIKSAYDCVLGSGADTSTARFFWNDAIGVFWMATGNTA
ncbi:rolling circle replication-associated protein [Trinickia terrae]|uniref:rolling circle replication-associated protein n=1 Tax=Trinickia terrae TaxID=2571161 RepID=UPI001F0D4ACC|nr:hypothetical protein [Trinickia terrae]